MSHRALVRAALVLLVTCCWLGLTAASSFGAAPANDLLANATVIPSEGGTITGTTVDADYEPTDYNDAALSDYGAGNVWFAWRAPDRPAPFSVTIDLCDNAPTPNELDTVDLRVFTAASGNAGPPIATPVLDCPGIDVDGALYTRATFTATPGADYRIAVYSFSGRSFQLAVRVPAASPDTDGDGIPDHLDDDIDGDGLSNDVERALGLDPYKWDTDGDGRSDAETACAAVFMCSAITLPLNIKSDPSRAKDGSPLPDLLIHLGDTPSTCNGRQGDDFCIGGGGADQCIARDGDDVCIGKGGDDRCLASAGKDVCSGGRGNDACDAVYRTTSALSAAKLTCHGAGGKDACSMQALLRPSAAAAPELRCVGGSGADTCATSAAPAAVPGKISEVQKPKTVCLGGTGNDSCSSITKVSQAAASSAIKPTTSCIGGKGDDICTSTTVQKEAQQLKQQAAAAPQTRCSGGAGTDTCVDVYDPKLAAIKSKTVCVGGAGADTCVSKPNVPPAVAAKPTAAALAAPAGARVSCIGGAGDDVLSTYNGSGGDFINGGPGNDICIYDTGDVVTGCEQRIEVTTIDGQVTNIRVDGASMVPSNLDALRRLQEEERRKQQKVENAELEREQQERIQRLLLEQQAALLRRQQEELARQKTAQQMERKADALSKLEDKLKQTAASALKDTLR